MTKLSENLTKMKIGTIVNNKMTKKRLTFGELFKKYRLKSEFSTLTQFGNALAREGFIYEDSIYSHWQKNVRIPKNRALLLILIKIFIEKGGIQSIRDANIFLESAGQGYLTREELVVVAKKAQFQEDSTTPENALSFLLTTIQSKRIVRTGWKLHGIRNPESVAEHSYQLCVMSMIFADQLGCDRDKLTKMALIHDLSEVITGDMVSEHGNMIDLKARNKKETMEAKGIGTMFAPLKDKGEYKRIFEEMVERKSHEANVFWQLDKLEMAIQALQYEQITGKNLEEFFVNTDLQLTLPFLREIFSLVQAARSLQP